MKLNFVKLTDKWFADVVNWVGSVMDLEMVNGAEIFLENISKGHRYVSLEVSADPMDNAYRFDYLNYDGAGTEYICEETGDIIWLCPVTISVFGEFPVNIWFRQINPPIV